MLCCKLYSCYKIYNEHSVANVPLLLQWIHSTKSSPGKIPYFLQNLVHIAKADQPNHFDIEPGKKALASQAKSNNHLQLLQA